ncbi:MAG: hypothetical protein ACRDUY_06975, partial [Nitriliruptorales bacterium]
MRSRRTTRIASVLALLLGAALAGGGVAQGHEERESEFPDGSGTVPTLRTIDEADDVVVVCKPDSGRRIGREISDPQVRAVNARLLGQCEFEHIQAAVEHVRDNGVAGTNIYVLPGLYLEEPSREAACNAEYDGGVVEYEDLYDCPTMTQLVGIMGDDPADEDLKCDNALCRLQIEGTGDDPEDVIIRGGFKDDGDWIDQHNGIKADRADGIYIRNLTTELFRENSIYVHETDGYALDRTNTRKNDLYGILTFASDHGVIRDCEASFNGDSGIYPGSPSDVNADNDETGPLERFAVEVFGCRSHHNALGHSGTAGNSIYLHDNEWFANSAGIVVDSFVPDHPGMPQDHLWVRNNRIYGNNANYYREFVHSGICDKPPAERGYEDGTVCPVFPVPVGTGIMIAGGNHNLVEQNEIYDNWRQGVMQFWVPAIFREEPDPSRQFDTSHFNHYVDNTMGLSPDGLTQPNGLDFWWDDEGEGNCWQGNTSTAAEDGSPTDNATDPRGVPACDGGGSAFTPSNPVKSAGLAPCAPYDREDNPDPPGCDWFDDPEEPEGREAAGGAADDGEPQA